MGRGGLKMKIHRAKLVEELFDFSLRGNGVIIGSPGIGKTYLLRELPSKPECCWNTEPLVTD